MKNRGDTEMIIAFKSCYTPLNMKRHHPTLYVLNNECSCAVKEYIISKDTNLQFVESYNRRVNAAKHGYKAIQYHTIVILCTIDQTCPIQLLDKFMPHIETTLNRMCISEINTTKLAYKVLNGRTFGWNRTLLASVGQQVLAFLTQLTHSHGCYTQSVHHWDLPQTITDSWDFETNSPLDAS